MRVRHRAAFCAAVVVALAGCGSSLARTPSTSTLASASPTVGVMSTVAAKPARATRSKPRSAIDRLAGIARGRYSEEVNGAAVHKQLRRVAADPVLLRALRTGDLAAVRAEIRLQDNTPHAHISRLRLVKGSRVLADAGAVFPVAPSQMALRDARGKVLGTLQLSIQDVIGYVKYLRRNVHVDVVVRGRGAGHVRTSLSAAAHASLPSSGPVTIAGRRYLVRSFQEPGLAGETLRIWILKRG
jgi:hypothetical protein